MSFPCSNKGMADNAPHSERFELLNQAILTSRLVNNAHVYCRVDVVTPVLSSAVQTQQRDDSFLGCRVQTVSSQNYTTKQRIDVLCLNVPNSTLTHLNTSANETILMHADGWFPSFHEASGNNKDLSLKHQLSVKHCT